MSKNKDFHLLQQATGDLARLFSGELSDEDVKNIGSWQQRDEVYQKHFVGTTHLLDELDVLCGDSIVDKWVEDTRHLDAQKHWYQSAVFGRSLSAIAALLLIVVGIYYLVPKEETASDNSYRYVTRVGEQKRIDLPDGSVVNINTNTKLLVSYTPEARNLQLLSGEAYFDVAKDVERPFRVTSGKQVVTVLGTQFNLREWPGKLELSVTEGVVSLARAGSDSFAHPGPLPASDSETVQLKTDEAYRISAGTVVKVDTLGGQMLAQADPELSRKLSWRNGVLRFEASPLSLVVEELNRYSAKPIVIIDSDISNLKIYSTFGVNRIDRALLGIEFSLPIRIEQTFDRIEIYKK